MAEIRSTLEMVMERAARMESDATDIFKNEDIEKQGMRLAAAYLRGEENGLQEVLTSTPVDNQVHIKKGIIVSLLRNITLPREENEQTIAEKAIQGLLGLCQNNEELTPVFPEMQSIIDRYLGHKKELKGQLEEQFAQQIAMMEQNLAQQTGAQTQLHPSQHPKFAEEWQRVQSDLTEQYGRAIDQYKDHIKKQLLAS
jgi:hypothetical protein